MEESELNKVIASANALIYVSLFEGFGIPIVEAMHCDIPVLTSNTSSMPEVGGEAVVYADPYSVNSIADGMEGICLNKELRKSLIEKAREQRQRFTWGKTAKSVWNSIERIL
jgi:glycosyltransferase involved in cell wall biosynthesis